MIGALIAKWFKNFLDQFPQLILTVKNLCVDNVFDFLGTNTVTDDTSKLIGNTGTLVFHNPDCQYSKSKKCTAAFSTKEEEIQAGYKACGTCKPLKE